MDKNSEIAARDEAGQATVVMLGIASVETKGGAFNTEAVGGQSMPGISEE
ncbi:hypothetical protein NRY95_20125 [Xanthomonas campestris pv. phormiicola]|nr:hypothetical protein [Xanthomonas campestris pv. phormiicola]UYC15964.1 hypothetical protein NRY95_20125 [Xanthomonas campestris pv. phormiicola]